MLYELFKRLMYKFCALENDKIRAFFAEIVHDYNVSHFVSTIELNKDSKYIFLVADPTQERDVTDVLSAMAEAGDFPVTAVISGDVRILEIG